MKGSFKTRGGELPACRCTRKNPHAGSMWPRITISVCLLVVSLTPFVSADESAESSKRLLKSHGLRVISNGHVWGLRDEQRLLRKLKQLDELKKNIQLAEKQLAARAEQNFLTDETLQQLESALRDEDKFPRNSKQRRGLEQRIATIRSQCVTPDHLLGVPDVQAKLVELTVTRAELAISLSWIRNILPTLEAEYARLQSDEKVTAALSRVAPKATLGPSVDFLQTLQSLAPFDLIVNTNQVPVYQLSGQYRVGAIMNEFIPVTFTWKSEGSPTIVTTSMVESAGLTVRNDAETSIHKTPDGRQLTVRRIYIPYLRFGATLLGDVEAWLLPPEGEDLGSQISATAFKGYQTQLEPEKLQLKVDLVE